MCSNILVKFKDDSEKLFENVVGINWDDNIEMIKFDIEGNGFYSAVNFKEVKYYEEIKEIKDRAYIIHNCGDGTAEKLYIKYGDDLCR